MFRAKFVCEHLDQQEGQQHVTAYAVINGSEENKSFAKFTPGGNLSLFISEDTQAYGQLVPGQEFYVDITTISIFVDEGCNSGSGE